jgi:hypothetical protein
MSAQGVKQFDWQVTDIGNKQTQSDFSGIGNRRNP